MHLVEVRRADALGDEPLRQLEDENSMLKRVVADLSLDKAMISEATFYNWRTPPCDD